MTEFRDAGLVDADAVAALHAESWRAHYRGILPDAYLDGQVFQERRAFWQDALRNPRVDDLTIVSAEATGLTGFVSVVRDGEPGFGAVIENLHVRPQLCGRGLGRRLLGEAVARLMAAGVPSACLWVYDVNEAAIGFYARLGGIPDKHGFDDFAGARAPDTRIVWPDLAVLERACKS
ncbi:MAG: GNAT family N-acetyltransferase [Rhodospirillales bacterium]|nr:GNAT family N-acetyltransferase [Rhodospirillales bacterium]MDH3912506.1 GNAT family N-acetyltransferase [Rhodospirillales bacterium]MDH3918999.1 GNAT family N-acetyltransferase [Rhodospirillales bacterium]MDH3965478.1 GNAT family N-acetyltransferase [Rhodospirillales bacterium]